MNLLLYGIMIVFAFAGFFRNIDNRKQSRLFLIFLIILFCFTVISRQYGYFSYSDLRSYIWRFINNDNAYFGTGYNILCNIIRSLFGTNINTYLASISILILGIAIISIKVWSGNTQPIFYNTFVLLFVTYWGVVFSSEVIRSGIAIVFSLLAIALAKEKKIFICIVCIIFSIAFHWTEIFIVPIILLMFITKDKSKGKINTSFFYGWMLILIFLDIFNFSYIFSEVLNVVLQLIVTQTSQFEHYLLYLNPRPRDTLLSFLSPQYIYYRVLALYLVYIFRKAKSSSILLYSYYIGLSIYTLMSSFGVVTRMQWIFTVPSIFLLYDYIESDLGLKNNKKIVVTILTVSQSVMTINYLGFY